VVPPVGTPEEVASVGVFANLDAGGHERFPGPWLGLGPAGLPSYGAFRSRLSLRSTTFFMVGMLGAGLRRLGPTTHDTAEALPSTLTFFSRVVWPVRP
jgi:hypothetical protein